MIENQFVTPILLLVFNRPEQTRKVFEQIKLVKPTKLYISADGPRENRIDEQNKCNEVRNIINFIDWECEVKTNFFATNQGCKIAVSSGITWFFDNVEEGIILEDDCLPSISFFYFAAELLERYKYDTRIGSITGYNYLNKVEINESYFFSNIGGIWGWATWRRVWKNYDVNITFWTKKVTKNSLINIFNNKLLAAFFRYKFNLTYNNKIDTWDYQFFLLKLINNYLTIVPSNNLVQNIGFDDNATHTKTGNKFIHNEFSNIHQSIIHPEIIAPDRKYDFAFVMKYASIYSIINFIKRIFK